MPRKAKFASPRYRAIEGDQVTLPGKFGTIPPNALMPHTAGR